ncbi:MAG: sigma-70 family RNA polymerase sigma factor [Nostocaceae cyanobacterium]|nr:sigma-70 family RNA polymerase sigma factor [Nostocaceae cyanobacterium]
MLPKPASAMTQVRNLDEPSLLAKIAQQDQAALAQLYDRYARVMYALAFKMLGTVEEAEEVVLDVFHQVWRTAGRYDAKKARVDTWLFMQVRSRSLDRLRARERMTRVTDATVDAAKSLTDSLSPNPEEEVLIKERRATVIAALQQLPKEQRYVLELVYYKGLTHKEIAAETGIALGTIKTRIRLGLTKLRSVLNCMD